MQNALDQIETFTPNHGGTDILKPLEEAQN